MSAAPGVSSRSPRLNPVAHTLLGPVLGYFGHGYFSMFGSFIAELFPTAVRGTG